jgi:hypothetical protein
MSGREVELEVVMGDNVGDDNKDVNDYIRR